MPNTDPVILSDEIAQLFGALVGGMILIYLPARLLEWVLLKRLLRSQRLVVIMSSLAVFLGVFGVWYAGRHEAHAPPPQFIMRFFLAALALPGLRILTANIKARRRSRAGAPELQ